MVFFDFRWFSLIFQNVPKCSKTNPNFHKIFPKSSKHVPKISRHFPTFSKNFQKHAKLLKHIQKLEVVFLHFEVWVADSKVFDARFGFSMSQSPRNQVLSRFRWIGTGFIRVETFKKVFLQIRSWG